MTVDHKCASSLIIEGKIKICFHEIFDAIRDNQMKDNEERIIKIKNTEIKVINNIDLFVFIVKDKKYFCSNEYNIKLHLSDEETKNYRVYNVEGLLNIIKDKNESILYYKDEVKNTDVLLEENCLNFLFQNNYELFDYMQKLILPEKEFYVSQISEIKKATDLSINYYSYTGYPSEKIDFIYYQSEERLKFFKVLSTYLFDDSKNKPLFICGPYSIGKTVSLLGYTTKKHKDLRSFYVNIKYCNNHNSLSVLKILSNELAKMAYKYDDYKNLVKLLTTNQSDYSYKKILLNFISNMNSKDVRFVLIVDQYREKYDKNNEFLNSIIEVYNKSTNMKLVVASSINEYDIKNNLIAFLLKEPQKFEYKYIQKLIAFPNIEGNFDDLKLLTEQLGLLPTYCYQLLEAFDNKEEWEFIEKLKSLIKKKIDTFFNENNICISKQISIVNNIQTNIDIALPKETFIDLISTIPIKFFKLDFSSFKISYHFPLIKEILEELVLGKINIITENINLRKEIANDPIFKGIFLEKSIENYVKEGIFIFQKIKIDKVIKVDSLIDWKFPKKITIPKNVTNIYINQSKQNAPCFDSALIILNHFDYNNNKIVLFQITNHKGKSKFKSKKDIQKNCKRIQNNIENALNIKIELQKFFYYFIFNELENDFTSMKLCIEHNIGYILFRPINYGIDKNIGFFNNSNCKRIAKLNLDEKYSIFEEQENQKCINPNVLNHKRKHDIDIDSNPIK